MQNEENCSQDGATVCIICKADMKDMKKWERETHKKICWRRNKAEIAAREPPPSAGKIEDASYQCSVCNKDLSGVKLSSRITHLKQCAKKHNIDTTEIAERRHTIQQMEEGHRLVGEKKDLWKAYPDKPTKRPSTRPSRTSPKRPKKMVALESSDDEFESDDHVVPIQPNSLFYDALESHKFKGDSYENPYENVSLQMAMIQSNAEQEAREADLAEGIDESAMPRVSRRSIGVNISQLPPSEYTKGPSTQWIGKEAEVVFEESIATPLPSPLQEEEDDYLDYSLPVPHPIGMPIDCELSSISPASEVQLEVEGSLEDIPLENGVDDIIKRLQLSAQESVLDGPVQGEVQMVYQQKRKDAKDRFIAAVKRAEKEYYEELGRISVWKETLTNSNAELWKDVLIQSIMGKSNISIEDMPPPTMIRTPIAQQNTRPVISPVVSVRPNYRDYSDEQLKALLRGYGVAPASRKAMVDIAEKIWEGIHERERMMGSSPYIFQTQPLTPLGPILQGGLGHTPLFQEEVSQANLAKQVRRDEKAAKVRQWVRAHPELYNSILQYQEVDLLDCCQKLKDDGIKCGVQFLADLFDNDGVCYHDKSQQPDHEEG